MVQTTTGPGANPGNTPEFRSRGRLDGVERRLAPVMGVAETTHQYKASTLPPNKERVLDLARSPTKLRSVVVTEKYDCLFRAYPKLDANALFRC